MLRENEPEMPEISTNKVCFVAMTARKYLSEDEGAQPDASNAADDGASITLTEAGNLPARRELRQFINALDADELDALVALAWIGRGDFEPSDWRAAVIQAGQRRETNSADYLMGLPLLPDYLEDALSAYDRSCEDFERAQQGD